MNQLTAEQAVDILDQVAAKYTGNRSEHLILLDAIKLLKDLANNAETNKS